MSMGPLGMIGSAAGSTLAQGQGNEVQRLQQNAADLARQTLLSDKAEQAEGIGQTEQDEQASDRDADGRRPWEIGSASSEPDSAESLEEGMRRSKDPTGDCGNHLDLSG